MGIFEDLSEAASPAAIGLPLEEAAGRARTISVRAWWKKGYRTPKDYGKRVALEFFRWKTVSSVKVEDPDGKVVSSPSDALRVAQAARAELAEVLESGNFNLAPWILMHAGITDQRDPAKWNIVDAMVDALGRAKMITRKVGDWWVFTLAPSLDTMARAATSKSEGVQAEAKRYPYKFRWLNRTTRELSINGVVVGTVVNGDPFVAYLPDGKEVWRSTSQIQTTNALVRAAIKAGLIEDFSSANAGASVPMPIGDEGPFQRWGDDEDDEDDDAAPPANGLPVENVAGWLQAIVHDRV